ncbi:MAG TPA: Rid family detoxifying hydrolase [Woeseiaceae bacterium]|nr:Rid family detoxifying hydrolase [Woeseiaceae bacterium]
MTKASLLLTCLAALCAACEPAVNNVPADEAATGTAPPEIEYINMPGMEELDLPFSAAVRVGHTIYLSGMIGNVPGTMELAPGGIQGQTRQALENIKATLEHAGSSMDRVVKCTVFLADMSEWAAMNEVYVTFFETPPARSAFGANGLALDGKLEIECIAVAGS